MGNSFGNSADDEEEQDDERLRRWRPGQHTNQHMLRRRGGSDKSSASSEQESGSDGQSVASSASKIDSDSEKSDGGGEADRKSDDGSGSGDSSDEESEDDDMAELARRELEKKKKKIVVRMEFEPLLSLHEPLATELEPPAELLAQARRRRKAERAERHAIEDSMNRCRAKAKAAAGWMADMGLDDCSITDLVQALADDRDELSYALVQSRRFMVDDEGHVQKALVQKILDVMESDIETLNEIVDKLGRSTDEDGVRQAVDGSRGQLRLKTANGIDLVEQVDQEAEQRLQRAMEREERQRAKEERRKAKAKRKRKKRGGDPEDEEEESSSSSGEDQAAAAAPGLNREAERRALAFRRLQVQRKIEEFLKTYTKGQHLTKINERGKRYHRRVYVDTTRKSLVVQGANGPKFFPFASMKEVDIETRTTKEGRVETLVVCAIEKRGRIVKELHLAFPDQSRANTFVNCVTLFALALRSKAGK